MIYLSSNKPGCGKIMMNLNLTCHAQIRMQQRGISQTQMTMLLTFGTKERQKGKSFVLRIRHEVLDQLFSYFGLSGKSCRQRKISNKMANEIANIMQYDAEGLKGKKVTALKKDIEGLKDIAVILSEDDAVVTTVHQYKRIRTEH
jgi:hypothetical protein